MLKLFMAKLKEVKQSDFFLKIVEKTLHISWLVRQLFIVT